MLYCLEQLTHHEGESFTCYLAAKNIRMSVYLGRKHLCEYASEPILCLTSTLNKHTDRQNDAELVFDGQVC
jgi:hypothetical protein